jgi:hypothetical protein
MNQTITLKDGLIGDSALSPILGAQIWEWSGYDSMLKIV